MFAPLFFCNVFLTYLGQTRYAWSPSSWWSRLDVYVHVTTVYVEKRENPIVNRLNKTKEERQVDHEQERIDRIKQENAVKRAAAAEKVLSGLPRITPHLLIQYQLTRESKMRNWPKPGKLRKLRDPMTRSSTLKKTKIHHERQGEN